MIINQPDSLSLASNLKPFLVSSSEAVSFQLYKGEEIILDESYTPAADNRVKIDVREIVKSQLTLSLPTTNIFQQSGILAAFKAIVDGVEVNFSAIRSGVENLADTATNFLSGNFLTWQPQVKKVSYSQPEWLTYYATVAGSLKVKLYLSDNTSTVVTISAQAAGTCFTYNVQFAHIMSLLAGDKYGYYDIWFENIAGERLTYIQRYVYSEMSEQAETFFFENSLGGIDTVIMDGASTFSPTLELAEGEYEDTVSQTPFVKTRLFKKGTGFKDKTEAAWLWDFFAALKRYKLVDGSLTQITLTDSSIEDDSSEDLKAFTFTYKLSGDLGLLNIQRSADPLPENLTITTPEGLFFLVPRLAEYPTADLVDSLLFLVQKPASESWQAIAWGYLYNALYDQFITSPIAALSHNHSNIAVLNGLSEVGGQLYYKGEPIQSAGAAVSVVNNLTSTSTTSALSANMGKYIKELLDLKQGLIADNTYAPYSHISDSVKHVTAAERTNWTSAYTASHSHANISALNAITSTKTANWDSAYSWGNHALAGYLTSASLGSLTNNLTTYYVVRWSGAAFVNSLIYDNGSGVSIGNNAPGTHKLNVTGTGYFSGDLQSAASVVAATSVKIGNWEIIKNADSELQVKLSGIMKAKLSSAGVITAESIVLNSLVLNGHTLTIE
jgi:hypothetical protein